ncbi:MAG: hypothetical protein Q9174_004735 [Haloplaca sp. 1 TL-2023]
MEYYSNYIDPDDECIRDDEFLIPRIVNLRPDVYEDSEDEWGKLIFEDHAQEGGGQHIKADPALQILYSFPDPVPEFYDTENTTWSPQSPMRQVRRKVLPVIIQGRHVVSRADSGSEDNIMIAELADVLHANVERGPEFHKRFRTANGKIITALGRVIFDLAFALEPDTNVPQCAFYVFEKLTSPVLLGMTFLRWTDTLVKHRHRFQDIEPHAVRPFQLCSLNSPRCRLYCRADLQTKLACADTGSELDLMSLAYVKERRFAVTEIEIDNSVVQFADGSTDLLAGKVAVDIILGTDDSTSFVNTFYILDNLSCDILFSEEFLDKTDAFKTYHEDFSLTDEDYGPHDVNTILWFNIAEWRLSQFVKDHAATDDKAGRSRPFHGTSKAARSKCADLAGTENHIKDWFQGKLNGFRNKEQRTGYSQGYTSGHQATSRSNTKLESHAFQRTEDARELHRPELAQQHISTLRGHEKEEAMFEEDMKIDLYERRKKQRQRDLNSTGPENPLPAEAAAGEEPLDLQPSHTTPSPHFQSSAAIDGSNSRHISTARCNVSQTASAFTCRVAGCSAAPFEAQNLLE